MSKKEKDIANIVNQISLRANHFIDYVSTFKCQCASTDRTIEKIIELSRELETQYNDLFVDDIGTLLKGEE